MCLSCKRHDWGLYPWTKVTNTSILKVGACVRNEVKISLIINKHKPKYNNTVSDNYECHKKNKLCGQEWAQCLCAPKHSYVEILLPIWCYYRKWSLLGGNKFLRVGLSWMGLLSLIERSQRSSLPFLCCVIQRGRSEQSATRKRTHHQYLACNQYPPRPAELQPKRLGSHEPAGQECWYTTAGRPSLGSSPLPQGPMPLPWPFGVLSLDVDSHQPWTRRFQSPCVQ